MRAIHCNVLSMGSPASPKKTPKDGRIIRDRNIPTIACLLCNHQTSLYAKNKIKILKISSRIRHFNPFTTEARFYVLNAIAFST